jgi:ATP-dependent helicase/nuclease subunit B
VLRIVTGRAGSGKSAFALDKACEIYKKGGRAFIIVPEQFTFETERALLGRAGPASSLGVEVLSFSRMVRRVADSCGGFAGRYIDDCGRIVLMYKAIAQVSDLLKVYGRQAKYPSFARSMLETASEYKLCAVSADDLKDAAKRSDNAVLRRKLSDISLIISAYDSMLSDRFADPADDLTKLAELIAANGFFRGSTVVIDSFKGFTAQEKAVILKLLIQADDVFVTLCSDINGREDKYGLFAPVHETAQSLISLAAKSGVEAAAPVRLGEPKRFGNDALRELEKRIFRPYAGPYDDEAEEIFLTSAPNLYDEAQFAAQEAARLIRDEGARCRDIVVISRGLDLYDGILGPAFDKYGIPLFYDRRRDVQAHPLVTLPLCALEIVSSGWKFEPVFRYLKTGLAGFGSIQIALLENYVLTWDIAGAQWLEEWTNNPDGFTSEMTEQAKCRLMYLNLLRERFVSPLSRLSEKLEASQGASDMIKALYSLLIETGADKAVQAEHRRLEESGEVELADEYRQIWEKLCAVFDQTAAVLGGESMTPAELGSLLKTAASKMEIGHIPPSLDEVTAGDAERIRAGSAKYAFIIGLADGIFPKGKTAFGVITDAEREELIGLGVELTPPARRRVAEERFIAYEALTCASQRIYLSYPRSDTAGKTMRASPFYIAVRSLFPRCAVRAEALGDELDSVQNLRSAFDMLALGYGRDTRLTDALLRQFSRRPEYAKRLAALKNAHYRVPARIEDKNTSRELFGERMNVSPSRLESYGQCRFLYFCRYGLGVRARRKAELMAPEIGTLIHFVLERLLSRNAPALAGMSDEKIDAETDQLLGEFADTYFGGLRGKPERFRYLYRRLRVTVRTLVRHILRELAAGDFYPVDFELGIGGEGGGVPAKVIDLPDGGSIAVEGKVDRVDLMKKNGRTYLRVIDYKTGQKSFNLPDVLYGLNLQMFIYLFTLCGTGSKRYGPQDVLPAGVLYLPAKLPDVAADRDEADDRIAKRTDSELKMSGLILADKDVVTGMERDGAGIFIPARVKTSDGEIDARSSVASFEQMGMLRRHIDSTLAAMASTLRQGDIAAVPVEGLGYHPCDYCEFSSVCGHEKGDSVKYLHGSDSVWDDIAAREAAREAADEAAKDETDGGGADA